MLLTSLEPLLALGVILLSADNEPGIYVYVENDPQTESRHIVDALETPIDTLFQRNPNQKTHEYLSWLHCARHSLFEQNRVKIITRDEARLSSEIKLPAWSFSSRQIPSEFHPHVYLHWPAVCEHLTYASKAYDTIIESGLSRTWVLGVNLPAGAEKWFVVSVNTRSYPENISGVECVVDERVEQAHFRVNPSPNLVTMPLPRKVTKTYAGAKGDTKINASVIEKYGASVDYFVERLKEMDVGTGLIYWEPETK